MALFLLHLARGVDHRMQAARQVDAALRVHGVQGLRVVDASVFRSVTSVNTQAPTVMLAWKAAGFIMAGD